MCSPLRAELNISAAASQHISRTPSGGTLKRHKLFPASGRTPSGLSLRLPTYSPAAGGPGNDRNEPDCGRRWQAGIGGNPKSKVADRKGAWRQFRTLPSRVRTHKMVGMNSERWNRLPASGSWHA